MDKLEKLYQLHRLFRSRRRPVPRRVIEEELGCSRATAKRMIGYLRDYLNAPIEYVSEGNGYAYVEQPGERFELPGVWFGADELLALLTAEHLLQCLTPGILADELAPLHRRITEMLAHRRLGTGEIPRRVRIIGMTSRPVDAHKFTQIAGALIRRRRLHVFYHGRARDKTTERTVSPQRLVHYRDNWYLDAWCHWREALRSFSLDRLHVVETRDEPACDIRDARLDEYFASSYGIFAGKPVAEAVLHFTPAAARWVADEQWHPAQQQTVLPDGSLELRVPYSDSRELIRDILKYLPEVKVISPDALRNEVKGRIQAAMQDYGVWIIEEREKPAVLKTVV